MDNSEQNGFRLHADETGDNVNCFRSFVIIDIAFSLRVLTKMSTVCGAVYVTVRCPSVRLSVYPIIRRLRQRALGLLLGAPGTGGIDRLHDAPTAGGPCNGRPAATALQQRGAQQQMRAVSRLQPQ